MCTEKIKTFLTDFYVDKDKGAKEFKYGYQLVSIAIY